jgi:hypothetical protein
LEKSEAGLKETIENKQTEFKEALSFKVSELQKWKDIVAENEKLLAVLRDETGASRGDHDRVMKDMQEELLRSKENVDDKSKLWQQTIDGKDKELEAMNLIVKSWQDKAEELEKSLKAKTTDADQL